MYFQLKMKIYLSIYLFKMGWCLDLVHFYYDTYKTMLQNHWSQSIYLTVIY